MIALSVNVNKIALLRNSRPGNFPCVVTFAQNCINLGAHGITVHPRPDGRHIQPRDVKQLANLITPLKKIELNIEGNPFSMPSEKYPGFLALIEDTKPDQCTLVPDSSDQLTSDHGFNLKEYGTLLVPIIDQIKSFGVRTSIFIDPDLEQVRRAAQVGADRIELYTGPFAQSWGSMLSQRIFSQHLAAAKLAAELGMMVNAGHDLNLENLKQYASIPELTEVSIGHALTIEALDRGLREAIHAFLSALN
ncbi:MAG: pyridoxine 5'-phosphate synthase [Cellvibrionales bacterium TMED49]|nr:pyridoxine 5'-phosphate synthase [Porticoccaceae bacterium]OUU39610.1 MAG: pyridoxine 5'-phosphate synthase [Cellvibrionales bacterium TMED49]